MKTDIRVLMYLAEFFVEWEMFQTKVVEKIKTYILCSVFFLNRAVYEIMWKNNVEPDRPKVTIWHMHIACWVTKATDTHSEYVILTAFPLQQRLHVCTSMYIHVHMSCNCLWVQCIVGTAYARDANMLLVKNTIGDAHAHRNCVWFKLLLWTW